MLNLPNLITLSRGLLAFFFLIDSTPLRALAAFLAVITDLLDGYLARLLKQQTDLGRILDPLVDKFFVFFAISVFLAEDRVGTHEVFAIIARDIVLVLFGLYLSISGTWCQVQISSTKVGKAATTLQFLLILSLCYAWKLPSFTYLLFIALGGCMMIELVSSQRSLARAHKKTHAQNQQSDQ